MLNLISHFNQLGGAKNIKSGKFPLTALLGALVLLAVRALIIMWSYNAVMPHVFVSMGGNPQTFRELTFVDSLMLAILVSSLA